MKMLQQTFSFLQSLQNGDWTHNREDLQTESSPHHKNDPAKYAFLTLILESRVLTFSIFFCVSFCLETFKRLKAWPFGKLSGNWRFCRLQIPDATAGRFCRIHREIVFESTSLKSSVFQENTFWHLELEALEVNF